MYEPGHVHRTGVADPSSGRPAYSIDLFYEVRRGAGEGPTLHVRMQGEIDGKRFEEGFELRRDSAFNFASVASRIAEKHGLHSREGLLAQNHAEFDAMFEDIRHQLQAPPGQPVDLDRL